MKQNIAKNHPGFTCQTSLIKRGWTLELLKKVFGEPDLITPNPHNPSGPPQKLYSTEMANLYEQTDLFKKVKKISPTQKRKRDLEIEENIARIEVVR